MTVLGQSQEPGTVSRFPTWVTTGAQAIMFSIPRHTGKKLDQKQGSWDLNSCGISVTQAVV